MVRGSSVGSSVGVIRGGIKRLAGGFCFDGASAIGAVLVAVGAIAVTVTVKDWVDVGAGGVGCVVGAVIVAGAGAGFRVCWCWDVAGHPVVYLAKMVGYVPGSSGGCISLV